jgi:hypothetical protein
VRQLQKVDSVEKSGDDTASEKVDLTGEQQVPNRMIVLRKGVPILGDDIIFPASGPIVPRNHFLEHFFFLRFDANKKPAELGSGGSGGW